MITKEHIIQGLDLFLDEQRFEFLRLVKREDYELVSFRSGYIEGFEMAKAIVLATRDEPPRAS